MNTDKRIQQLLNAYAERPSPGLQDRVRDRIAAVRRAKMRAVSLRWAFAGALVLIAVLSGFLLVPRVALAERLRQVHQAISTAKSVQFTVVSRANGKERVVYRGWTEGGNSRRRRSYSPGTTVDSLVKDGKKWTYAEGAPAAVQEPYDPGRGSDEFDSDADALAFAKEITAAYGYLAPSDVGFEPHADVDGRKTFCIVAERNEGRIHAAMVVDATTNLPISITMDVRSQMPGALGSIQTRAVSSFKFNAPVDRRVFEPVFGPDVKIVVADVGKTHSPEVVHDSEPSDFVGITGIAYAPEVLYSIRYGSDPGQIGVGAGPLQGESSEMVGNAGFAIRKGGNLVVADRVNRKVKEFDPHGELVMCTEGDLDSPAFVAPGVDGAVFAVSGTRRDTLSKFGRRGELLWSVRAPGAIPASLHLAGRLAGLSVSNDGTVAARLDGTDWMVCFSKDGKFESVRPAIAFTVDGTMVSFLPALDEADATEGVLMDSNGRILSKTRLAPMPSASSPIRPAEVGEFRETLRDDQGCWYRIWVQRKEKRIELARDLQVRSECVVTKYTADGVASLQGIVDLSPFDFPQSFTVDPDGRLYTLSYHGNRVSLIRYRLPTTTAR